MEKKTLPGHENVYVLGVQDGGGIVPAQTPEQVDALLSESLEIQRAQVADFVADLRRLGDRPDTLNYGSLMNHLQQECVFHLSALATAAIMRVRELEEGRD